MVEVDILWQGGAISCMKTFGTYSWRLSMQEQLEIYKASKMRKMEQIS